MAETTRVLMLALRSSDYLIETDELSAAATILQNYLNAHPAHPQVLQRLGKVRLLSGEAKEAAALFRQALCIGEHATEELSATAVDEVAADVSLAVHTDEVPVPSVDLGATEPDPSDTDEVPELALA